MSTYIKTYKFKLKPTPEQIHTFECWLGACRYVYNLALETKKYSYDHFGLNITKYDLQKEITQLRKEYSWINDVHSQVLQDVTDRLFISYDNFFRGLEKGQKVGFPKFAKKNKWSSFIFKQSVKIYPNVIVLPKIGKVKYHNSQEIKGIIKTTTIIKDADGWYVSMVCEVQNDFTQKGKGKMVGIDLGIKDKAICSDGTKFKNNKLTNKYEKNIAKWQKRLSRKKKGSKNRNKIKKQLALAYKKVRDIRQDELHKMSTKIVNENQIIILEDLRIENMVQNHNLAKSIYDAAWGKLGLMLEYKAKWNNGLILRINPRNTSRECSKCGWLKEDLTLSMRTWVCQGCGIKHDRDINAANNILKRGLAKLEELYTKLSNLSNKNDEEERLFELIDEFFHLNGYEVGHTLKACGSSEMKDIAFGLLNQAQEPTGNKDTVSL